MKIVILSTQRSGSTLVCDDFFGTGKLGRPTEHFIPLINDQSVSIDYINKYLRAHAESTNGVQAVKVMSNQIEMINRLFDQAGGKPYKKILGFNKNNKYPYLFGQFKDAQFFRVYRKDKVAQAVSLEFSEKTDVFHLVEDNIKLKGIVGKETSNDDIRNVTFEYDSLAIKKRLEWIEKQEQHLDEFIKMYAIKPIIINYEDILDQNDYIKTIGEKLGIQEIQPSPRTLKKIGGASALSWINKYKLEYNN